MRLVVLGRGDELRGDDGRGAIATTDVRELCGAIALRKSERKASLNLS